MTCLTADHDTLRLRAKVLEHSSWVAGMRLDPRVRPGACGWWDPPRNQRVTGMTADVSHGLTESGSLLCLHLTGEVTEAPSSRVPYLSKITQVGVGDFRVLTTRPTPCSKQQET